MRILQENFKSKQVLGSSIVIAFFSASVSVATFSQPSGGQQVNQQQYNQGNSGKVLNYEDRPLNVDGQAANGGGQQAPSDRELDYINNELNKQKDQIYLNREKTKKYKKLQDTTEKLVDATEDYIEEKKESEKIIENYNQRIKCLLEENYSSSECQKINRRQQEMTEAPIEQEVAEEAAAPVVETKVKGPMENKVEISVGTQTYNGSQINNLTSDRAMNAKFITRMHEKWDLGVQLETSRISATYNIPLNYGFSWGFVNSRSIEQRSMGLGFFTDYLFLGRTGRSFVPHLRGGLSISRQNLEFTDGINTFQASQIGGGDSTYTWDLMSVMLGVGGEYIFTPGMTLSIDLGYQRGMAQLSGDNINAFDTERRALEDLAEDFAEANVFFGTIGIGYRF